MTAPLLPSWAVEPLARVLAAWPDGEYSIEAGDGGRIVVRISQDGEWVSTAVLMPPLEQEGEE